MEVSNNRIKTKECFVAFIDVLGFSQLIAEDGGTGKKLQVIKDAIDHATIDLKARKMLSNHKYAFWYREFQVKSFSDCFCFSIPLEFDDGEKDYKQNFVSFYIWIEVFCNTLLKHGFLCRGGITQGWHYHDDQIIFSQALVDAYILESKKATHPMIMIHENLIRNLVERNFRGQPYYEYMFAHDNAGKSFLHPFNYSIVDELFFGFYTKEVKKKFLLERKALVEMFLQIIDKKISSLIGNSSVEKWQWMRDFSYHTLRDQYSDKFYKGLFSFRNASD